MEDNYLENIGYNLHITKASKLSKYFMSFQNQSLPPMVDLRDKFQKPYKQGKLGSCTANALCGLIGFLHPSFHGSRLFLYYNERAICDSIPNDDGANLNNSLKCLENIGICSEKMWPYDFTQFTNKPSIECYEYANKHKIKSAQIRDSFIELKKALANNYPFVVGIQVYDSFEKEEVAKTGIISMPNKSTDKLLGGHAVVCCGYKTINNQFYWIMRNSWGNKWGDQGYFYLPKKYFLTPNMCTSFWTLYKNSNHKKLINNKTLIEQTNH
jgi:C1A family cysteine protease